MSQKFASPFLHYRIQNFLKDKEYKRAAQVYAKLQFKQKQSDLFHFFQTNELAEQKSLDFFKNQLDRQFSKITSLKDRFYTTFASYYFKDNYLLCHDDQTEDRQYAFSYYLQDYSDGGQLVLFDETATKQVKRIKVTKNTLVIFQVSDISYHQVAHCRKDGRKAITGWFNIKNLGKQRQQKLTASFVQKIPVNAISFPLSSTYASEQYFQMMDVDYKFNIVSSKQEGPFFQRKICRIQIQPTVVFQLQGYQLISADFYKFRKGDYMLLNDPVNNLETKGIIDIFVTSLPKNYKKDENDVLVKILNEKGEQNGIPQVNDSIFIVNRKDKQYYVNRCKQEFILAHMIYRKKTKSAQNKKANNQLKKPKSQAKNKKKEVKDKTKTKPSKGNKSKKIKK